ncbi:peptidase M48 [Cunninghamella echinulata]|nr:peptidase M48 [Cunninghamella echinulata]
MAKQAYAEVMNHYGNRILPKNHPYTRFVTRVAKRLIQVSGMEDLNWEFYVIDSPERNAFVLPGGKVFVFTGILPIVENEDGMAAVLGHEISHQIARHSAEKLSFAKILLALQLTFVLFGIDPNFIFNQFTLNFLMMKPFSRKCEKEADTMGLDIMAQACFNPREAVNVWRRMEDASLGKEIPQFASTHPSHQNRIVYLQERMPEALNKREMSDCSTEMQLYSDMFKQVRSRW